MAGEREDEAHGTGSAHGDDFLDVGSEKDSSSISLGLGGRTDREKKKPRTKRARFDFNDWKRERNLINRIPESAKSGTGKKQEVMCATQDPT